MHRIGPQKRSAQKNNTSLHPISPSDFPRRAVLLTLKNCNIVYNKYMHSVRRFLSRPPQESSVFPIIDFLRRILLLLLHAAVCSLLKNYIIWHFFLFISSGIFFFVYFGPPTPTQSRQEKFSCSDS